MEDLFKEVKLVFQRKENQAVETNQVEASQLSADLKDECKGNFDVPVRTDGAVRGKMAKLSQDQALYTTTDFPGEDMVYNKSYHMRQKQREEEDELTSNLVSQCSGHEDGGVAVKAEARWVRFYK